MASPTIRFTLEEQNFIDFYNDEETTFKVGEQEYIIRLGIPVDEAAEILSNGPEEPEEDEEEEQEPA